MSVSGGTPEGRDTLDMTGGVTRSFNGTEGRSLGSVNDKGNGPYRVGEGVERET